MNIVLDIIGSLIVRGTIVAIVVAMNISLNRVLFERTIYASLKQDLAVLSDILRSDFRSIGNNVPTTENSILDLSSTQFRFRGDIDNNGTIDTVTYTLGSNIGGTASIPNPNYRKLYRQVGTAASQEVGQGASQVDVRLYDSVGAQLSSPYNMSLVRSFSVKIVMQEAKQINDVYPSTTFEQHFFPPNL